MAKPKNDTRVTRRRVLAAAAAAGTLPLLTPQLAEASGPSLVVFLHLDMKQRALQEMLGSALDGVAVTAVGRYGDLERQIASGASAVLAIGPVLSSLGLKPAVAGINAGRETEPYALLGRKRPPSVHKVGAVDLLGRKGTNNFVHDVLKTPVEVERVTKLEDMLRLLQFEMADAILLPERMVGAMRSKSELQLETSKAPSEVSLPALGVLTPSGNSVADKLKRVPASVRAQLGVDSWR
jgi:hypothetical protein